MNAWFVQHGTALASAFRRLWSAPLNTLLSLLVIGIALTLPAFGYVLLDSLRDLGGNVSGVQQISLFMKLDASRKEIGEIENRLRQAATGKWRFVPKEDALKRLQDSEGMAEIVASLPRNPLPDAFIVEPTNSEPEALEILRKEIAGWPKVAHVQLDSAGSSVSMPSSDSPDSPCGCSPASSPPDWWRQPSTPSACRSWRRPPKSRWRA